MKKLMLLAAMLAIVLVAAAPALAQATAVQYDNGDEDNSVSTAICTNIIEEIDASQVQYGNANAASVEGDAAAGIAQKLGVTITQVNNCFNTYLVTGIPGPSGPGEPGGPEAPKPVEPGGGPGDPGNPGGNGSSGGISVLPDTGGASLLTLGVGALLVGGGLLARRIFQ